MVSGRSVSMACCLFVGLGANSHDALHSAPVENVPTRGEPAWEARESRAEEARLQEHRRATEEGERVSRSMTPSTPPPAANPFGIIGYPNGVLQFPLAATPPDKSPRAAGMGCHSAPGQRTARLMKIFPEVTWQVCVTDMGKKGLWVGPVSRTSGASPKPWTDLIHQAGLADIFVPYHQGSPRLYDMRFTQRLDQVTAQDAGPNGALIYLSGETIPTVVAEIRERGVAWLCKGNISAATRRGQELVIWGVSDAGNYDNIIEYTFRDDGSMVFRTGNTGYNSPPRPTEPHTHNALWRIDLDLNGAPNDSASWLEHRESATAAQPLQAQDVPIPILAEGQRLWDGQINSLLVTDSATNAFGNALGYELSPLQHGASRHFGSQEAWTQGDVFVTRYYPTELGWTTAWTSPDNYLMAYLNNEPTSGQDLVLWARTAAHHHPSDEDRASQDLGTTNTTGITLTHWSGVRLDPYNSHNSNPMGGPKRCGT